MNASASQVVRGPHAATASPQPPVLDEAERIGAALRDALSTAANGDATRACSMLHELAGSVGVPLILDRPAVLAVHQPWFDISASEFTQDLLECGFVPCWFEPDEPFPAGDASGDEAGDGSGADDVNALRELDYRGVSLWEVARYDFCVRHELSLAEAESNIHEQPSALRREYARARALIDRVERYLDVYQPQCALIAQGHIMASAVVRAMAHARGIRVVAIENTFHSERLLWDDDAALPVVASRAKSVWLREGSRVVDGQAEAYVANFLQRAKSLKSEQHVSPGTESPWSAIDQSVPSGAATTGSRGRIVILGQVATDASVLFGLRRGFTRQLDMIRCVASYADRHGHALVVKMHPKEASGESPLGVPYDRLSERQLKADPVLAGLLERGAFTLDADNAFDTDRLTADADVCVAVNSQAGLEALVRGREVVLCGEAFYGNLGLTHEAEDPASLELALTRALGSEERRNCGAEAKRFFWTYLETLCRPKTSSALVELCFPSSTARSAATEAVSAPSPSRAPAPTSVPPRHEREAYDSGERQTAVEFDDIRADHRARYDFASAWLTPELARARRGAGALLGLDAFCGNGYGAARLASVPHVRMQGIDASEDAIAVAQEHFGSERVEFRAQRFPCELPAESFDFVTCFESLEHVDDDEGLLETLAGALAPGGMLFVSVPNEATLPIAQNAAFFRFHVRHYLEEQLVELAESKGLKLRARTGQHAYHTAGPRAVKPLDPGRMGLDPAIVAPHFLVLAFEKISSEPQGESSSVSGLRLDLGCGERGPKPGFEGVDIRPLPGIAHVTDMFALDASFNEDSIAELYCRHAFEHLSFEDGERAMACWTRVLAPGGRLHVIVPDIRYHIMQFLDADPTKRSEANPAWSLHEHACAGFWGWQRETGTVWDIHKSGYDFAMMRTLLERHGFEDIVRVDDDPWHLNVIATRPRVG